MERSEERKEIETIRVYLLDIKNNNCPVEFLSQDHICTIM